MPAVNPKRNRNEGRRGVPRLLTVLLLVCTLVLPAAADKAGSAYKKGRDAEARQNWQQAYEFYKQAYDLKPKELRYRTAYERSKFQAAAAYVHQGQVVRDGGNLEQALALFQKAVDIDPASFIAQQEARRTREMIEKHTTQPSVPTPPLSQLGRMAAEAAGPVELKPVSTAPISTLKINNEDSKVVYTTVGKLAGINVLFDPDYVSRRVTVDLNNVSIYQALEILAMQSKTFWRPVTPNTIFVATDTKAKRTELEQNVIKTFYLSNLSQTTEIQDVVNALRTVVNITQLLSLPAQSAIIVRGTPDQVALAEKLINDIDKARPEIVVDIAVMQVSRDKLRNMGITPPTSGTIQLQPNASTTTTPTTSGTGTTTTPATTTTNNLTLNKLANLTSNDFLVNIPGATATFLFTDSDTKIIQNPQIRALDGQKATLKIGDRVPVATGSFQPGIGGVGINPLVNTQFQYIDVGVNIDVTPNVHAGREVTLKITMEVSSVSSHVSIGGIDQPVIGQRRVEHTIRLKEGEVSLMGGMLEQDDLKTVNGYPFLSQIPILKYLFSTQNTEHKMNEIVFVLIPHVVRAQEVSELNLRPLDVGSASNIELRHAQMGLSPLAPNPAQPAANRPAEPGAQPTPAPAAAAELSFDPPQITQPVGATFAVNVNLDKAQNIYQVPVQINYDPKQLQLLNVSNGNFLSRDGQAVALVHRPDESSGTLQVSASRPPGSGGVSGQGTVFTLTFMAKAGGQSTLSVSKAGARDPNMQPVQVSAGQATVVVK